MTTPSARRLAENSRNKSSLNCISVRDSEPLTSCAISSLDQARQRPVDESVAGAITQHDIELAIPELFLMRQVQKLAGLAVDDQDAIVGIQHEQAMRHIVECRVEPVGNQRYLARRDDIL